MNMPITDHHEPYNPGIILFKRSSGDPGNSDVESAKQDETESKRKRTVICALCGTVITTPDKSIDINGGHSHVFKNPAGVVYRIGCFSEAKGCKIFGEPTMEYTWFPGFRWCYALCSGCFSHLGWHYQSNSNSFFGLILVNLAFNEY